MKMGVGTRIVFTIFLCIVMALCVAVIFASFGGFAEADMQALWNGFLNTGYKYIWAAAALVLFITALCLAFFGIRSKSPELRAVVLEEDPDSSIRITLDALKELAARYLKDIPGVITGRIGLQVIAQRNVMLQLELSARQEMEIPEVSRKIATEIKEYIGKYSGVEVSRVEISIQPLKQVQIV